jgi:hypothetical protein
VVDQSKMPLGRKALRKDIRTLRLSKYLARVLPTPPEKVDWSVGIKQWGMMLNDRLGDCTIAALGHAIQTWTANTTGEATVPDLDIETAYEQWCGYNAADPQTDNGGVELDVLNDWRHQEQGLSGHTLLGYADPKLANLTEVRTAINLFGGLYIGLSLPLSAQNQGTWDLVSDRHLSEPGSWGGHAVFVLQYDSDYFTCVTWGQLQKMTVDFWNRYVDEAHALLSPDWIEQKTTTGRFDLPTLQADLAAF